MQGDDGEAQLRFPLPAEARGAQVEDACRKIGELCRSRRATRAMLVASTLQVSESELAKAFTHLSALGCGPGFKLACVTPLRASFEALVKVEDSALSEGIAVRVFFDEDNARRWLSW